MIILLFHVLFPEITVNATCANTFDSETQLIKTPNYPEMYPNSQNCIWILRAPLGMRLKLNSFNYKIEDHDTCNWDYLKIYDGETENNEIAKLCGEGEQQNFESDGNALRLHFHSDSFVQGKGFEIKMEIFGKS